MDLIEKAIKKYGSVAEVARQLKVSAAFVSTMRSGRTKVPAYQAARLGELLGENPVATVLTVLEDQARNQTEKKKWHEWAKQIAACLIAGIALLGAGTERAGADTGTLSTKQYPLHGVIVGHVEGIDCEVFISIRGIAPRRALLLASYLTSPQWRVRP